MCFIQFSRSGKGYQILSDEPDFLMQKMAEKAHKIKVFGQSGGGVLGSLILLGGRLNLFSVSFSINTLLYFMFFIILGLNIITMFLIVKLYAYNHDYFPRKSLDWNERVKEDVFIFAGVILIVVGIILSIIGIYNWKAVSYGELEPERIMRITIPAGSLIAIGTQSMFSGFMMSIIKVKSRSTDGN